VEHDRGRRREVAKDDLLGARALEREVLDVEAARLVGLLVVADHLGRRLRRLAHGVVVLSLGSSRRRPCPSSSPSTKPFTPTSSPTALRTTRCSGSSRRRPRASAIVR